MKTLIQRSCHALLLGFVLLFALPPQSNAQTPNRSDSTVASQPGDGKGAQSGVNTTLAPGNSSPAAVGSPNPNSSDPTGLAALFGLIAALSAATQRLVEIVKGWCSKLFEKPVDLATLADGATDAQKAQYQAEKAKHDAMVESYEFRVHVLAAICGIVTACMSWPAIKALTLVKDNISSNPHLWPQETQIHWSWSFVKSWWVVVVTGLLSSSTSGPWNSISDWLKSLKKP